MTEDQVRNIVREEMQRMISSVYGTPIEMVQLIATSAQKSGFTKTVSSSKTVASATQAVAESGTASYNVCKVPSGFFLIDGTNFNVPYFTS